MHSRHNTDHERGRGIISHQWEVEGEETADDLFPDEQPEQLPMAMVAGRKRVLLLAPSPAPLMDSSNLIEAMRLRGHGITCCVPQFDERSRKILRHLGVETRTLDVPAFGVYPVAFRRAALRLRALFEALTPDLVVAFASKTGPAAILSARVAKAPHVAVVVSGLNPVFAETDPGRRWINWPKRSALAALYRYALRESEAAVFHCSDDEKLFKSLGLLPKGTPSVSVNGGGADMAAEPEVELPALDKGLTFLMAADLDDAHGVRDYCEAAQLLQGKARNIRCILVGGEPKDGKAVPLKDLRRFRGVVRYIGPREDLRPYVERCHVFVAPSRGGGVTPGMVTALTVGRPLITTATRGCRDLVDEGVNGVIAPPRDPQALAKAMTQVLHRPDLLPGMARASRTRARHHLDVHAINEIVLETLGL
jgi:glycosyltransferase involved in cell wall biosynthesis